MMYIEASSTLRLRPSHLLLLIYRYVSGVYQAGDLFALNYIKGFLDAQPESRPKNILTVSGHGIGEAEVWLADRFDDCHIDTVSFRLIDTQLLHFLRATEPNQIETVFSRFAEMVSEYEFLSELVSSPGLVPYWCNQAQQLKSYFQSQRIAVFSDHPCRLSSARGYDLIYVSQGTQYLSIDASNNLREHLAQNGRLAILAPHVSDNGNCKGSVRFASAETVLAAKALFKSSLKARGYVLAGMPESTLDLSAMASRTEISRFSVLATAKSVLLGELILASLGEHISDRARLQVLNDTAGGFRDLHMPVNEELQLFLIDSVRAQ
jgi:hypothetical protein